MFRKIVNFEALATTNQRLAALSIAETGLQAIDTKTVIAEAVAVEVGGDRLHVFDKDFSLSALGRIVVVGVGKCALRAAEAIETALGNRLSGGVVIDVKPESESRLKKIRYFGGTHPFPSEKNVRASRAMKEALAGLSKKDLVIAVVSGGGSTLLCLPADAGLPTRAGLLATGETSGGGSCLEEKILLEALFAAGADIHEINTVRKHMSLVRGGFLAQYAYPAQIISLIFSDVPGIDPSFVASGPTMKDTTTVKDAITIIKKYQVFKVCDVENCGLLETPKDDKYFSGTRTVVAVSNERALNAMEEKASDLGFKTKVFPVGLSGEAKVMAETIVKKLRGAGPKTALLYGGETVVKVDRHGRGGRNGELALSALQFVGEGELVAAVASDGRDNGPYAGAIADTVAREKVAKAGLSIAEHLANHDPAPVFEATKDFLMTGDTGSNVSDLLIAIKN